eukprot:TRINITY_DN4217_c0_g4_i1.p1 TRINITY_DN4217_c0_g4~~TRINITY_DN4217_c0_g4_i1.p1  ORF type:complete len:418 (-),score=149.04 TRINITY_DN4217_c0_g4_i1:22-1275(-)
MFSVERSKKSTKSLRYCHYNMTGSQSADQSQLLASILKSKGLESLKTKLEDVLEEARKVQVLTMRQIEWRGKTVEIKTDKLRNLILNCQQIAFDLEKFTTTAATATEANVDKMMELYDKLLVGYSDAVRMMKDELADMAKESTKQKLGAKKVEGIVVQLQALSDYVTYQKLSKTAERNLLLADLYRDKLEGKAVYLPPSFTKKSPKPEDLIRLFETLIQNTTDMGEVWGSDDLEHVKEIQAKVMSFKAARCFYIALSYEDDNKFGEAFALLDRTQQLLTTAHQHYDKLKTPNQKELLRLETLDKKAVAERCIMNAKGFQASLNQEKEKTQEKEKEKEKEKEQVSKDQKKESIPLLSCLDQFDQSCVKNKHLIGVPPDIQPIQCKPLVFDLALMTYEPPSLDKRKEAPKGGFFSFWRR